jgi:hypothetical protein
MAGMLGATRAKPELVVTPEEVLQIEPGEGEEIRLMITDSDINNVIPYQDYGGEYEDINYRQYQKSDGSVPSGATEALYLIQDEKDQFKLIHKKLISK